jgi:uncharacterized membrane protein
MTSAEDDRAVAGVVDRNIGALLSRRQRHEENKSFEDRVASAVTGFAGSMMFAYIHLTALAGWLA